MNDPTYPLFPIFAFLGFIISLIPLPWHLQAWNSGTCYYMMWTALACLNQFVNSVVWAGNALNPAPIWCDISIRIIMGASVGIPAASLCIVRRLYLISHMQVVTISRAEKRRAVLVDTLICVLFPIVFIPLQYVVQGHRFNIFEDIGCSPAIYNTLLAYFLYLMWPVVLGLIAAVYCVLALWEFRKRQVQFNQLLSSHTSLTISRYLRLIALAMTTMLCTTPLAVFIIILDATAAPLGPWRSWSDTHFAYSRVEQIPSVIWRSNHLLVVSLELGRWIVPVCAIVFFAFFGFAQEARKNYRIAAIAVLKRLELSSPVTLKSFKSFSHDLRYPNPVMVNPMVTLPEHSASSSSSLQLEKRFTSSSSSPDYISHLHDDIPMSLSITGTYSDLKRLDSLAHSTTTSFNWERSSPL